MRHLIGIALLAPALTLAHPGHGKTGFLHNHTLEDLALVSLGLAVVFAASLALVRFALKKKRDP